MTKPQVMLDAPEAVERPKYRAFAAAGIAYKGDVIVMWPLGHGESCYTVLGLGDTTFDTFEDARAAIDGLRGDV